jgi:transposase
MNEPAPKDAALPGLEVRPSAPLPSPALAGTPSPRLKPINRSQLIWQEVDVDGLVEEDHAVRAIWDFVGRLNLESFYAPIEAVQGVAGRTPWDPRLLICLWLYASCRGITSARELARRCAYEPAFRWLAGTEQINHHTLSDFRVAHDAALKKLLV